MASICRSRVCRAGFTLIEMLVAMAITLIMMGGVISMFGVVSEGIKDSRATMEMTERVTAVRNRLQTDLKGCTAEMKPPLRPEDAMGYFEYIEGIANDWTYTNNMLPSGAAIASAPTTPYSTLMGDTDDILMFTSRSRSEPFTGRGLKGPLALPTPGPVQSQVAEIVWFAVPNGIVLDPNNDDPLVGPAGAQSGIHLRTVYRRVLLVAPQLQPFVDALRSAGDARAANLLTFQRYFDLSAHWDATAVVGGYTGKVVLNTLSELTKPENRFAHGVAPVAGGVTRPAIINPPFDDSLSKDGVYTTGSTPDVFMALTGISAAYPPAADTTHWPASASGLHANLCPLTDIAGTLYRQGEDVIASNVLAFDVRAYDPGAPQLLAGSTIVGPCDAGYIGLATSASPPVPVKYGGFVDLWYWNPYTAAGLGSAPYLASWFANANDGVLSGGVLRFNGQPAYSTATAFRSYPAVYDTWSLHYEADGINQGGGTVGIMDAASNGIDDDGFNGVDDANERETSPPFPHPMRGIMVKIREYDVSTRSVKEVSVLHDFMPE